MFSFAMGARTAILCSAVLWGTFWIPLRQLGETGFPASWAITASFVLCVLILLPHAIRHHSRIRAGGWQLAVAGLLLGLAVALYSEGIMRGSVSRVILLFYLTPVWSSLFARWMLGDPIGHHRILAICFGLMGMSVILGIGSEWPVPRTLGDWMGLISGIVWALSAVYLRRTGSQSITDRSFVQFLFLAPLFLILSNLPGAKESLEFTGNLSLISLLWLFALPIIWLIPATMLIVSGASKIDPGQVAIFLMLEVVIGVSTAAVWAGEHFGIREAIGTLLILSAGGFEAIGKKMSVRSTRL